MAIINITIGYSGDFVLTTQQVNLLKELFPDINFFVSNSEDIDLEVLQSTHAFVGWPTNDMLGHMPNLKWIQLPSAGANGILANTNLHSETAVTNSRGVFGVPGAEHALALMLYFSRQLYVHVEQQARRYWRKSPASSEIEGSTVGIVGLGDIGLQLAKRVKSLGATVLGVKNTAGACPPFVDEVHASDKVEEVLRHSDYVINTLPLTPDTKGFFSATRLSVIKRGAVFINIGRGATVDEGALIDHVRAGRFGGVGLDVTNEEPLPASSPLWTLPNTIITSHSVGASPKVNDRRFNLIVNNIRNFMEGRKLENLVDRVRGY
ncbi:D-2-hydroxyacid dehydrogenase [Alicyclobacillus macrosporangiidus]|uniref:D-2-hydroxyacid dehydrogenase n=1 Tax=Alicyclobacillus macrosporangiidus TaxID=392015 RepID=UPI0009DD2948|nr:D-2-hydroxyacid dehydrogenase [Alicyclobacillus macrosporangiidus]